MRKLIVIAATLAAIVIPAGAAGAVPPREFVGEQTFRLYTNGGASWAQYVITINVKDDPWLGNFAEALVEQTGEHSGDYPMHDFRVDYIHLRDQDAGVIVESSGPTGWITLGDVRHSTEWWDTCGGQREGDYRAIVRLQGRSGTAQYWFLSDWKKVDSLVRFVGC
jgi:hypothetical protein